ncbi:hypothetical protein CEUSTIGMA_g7923.t1 [Chlamydomonas eustigma]|uniref:Btz domain-containing protein n=1 Tax=Chlamydomonas eustigma TaxID=1157962 RepID=A0A250XBM7_9CHLO|nr:hypothetical protein CEUSTIGMA_g7923.t1 [Chlamydomonas eustigma]|eukprot:GAX80485.1 hypothetical protein CEUSTIGMA_g7923.t1 [Chlamydomonas eustigma]
MDGANPELVAQIEKDVEKPVGESPVPESSPAVMETAIVEEVDDEPEISLPARRKKASDDGDDPADDEEFHDADSEGDKDSVSGQARKVPAGVSDLKWGDQAGDSSDEAGQESVLVVSSGTADQQTSLAKNEEDECYDKGVLEEEEVVDGEESKDEDTKPAEKSKKKEPFEVPMQGAFWLHDDRFDEAEAAAMEEQMKKVAEERKNRSDKGGDRWKHDRFGLEDEEDSDYDPSSNWNDKGRGQGRGSKGGRGSTRPGRGDGYRQQLSGSGERAQKAVGERSIHLPGREEKLLPSRPPRGGEVRGSGVRVNGTNVRGSGDMKSIQNMEDMREKGGSVGAPLRGSVPSDLGGRGRGAGAIRGRGGERGGGRVGSVGGSGRNGSNTSVLPAYPLGGGAGRGERDHSRGGGRGDRSGRGTQSDSTQLASDFPPLVPDQKQDVQQQPARGGPRRYTQMSGRPSASQQQQQMQDFDQGGKSKGLSPSAHEYIPPMGDGPSHQQGGKGAGGTSGGAGSTRGGGKKGLAGNLNVDAQSFAPPQEQQQQQRYVRGTYQEQHGASLQPAVAPRQPQQQPAMAPAMYMGPPPMHPSIAAMPPGEPLVVAMAQQAAQQYAITDPSVIAWLQGGLRQAMEAGAPPEQAWNNMQAYLQQHMGQQQQQQQPVYGGMAQQQAAPQYQGASTGRAYQ